jgi:hypothetical protein
MTVNINDMANRIRSVLPTGWFPDTQEKMTPVLDGLLSGFAWPWAFMHQLLTYAAQQSRLQSSNGIFIDLASQDYFGGSLPRQNGESDSSYIERIKERFTQEKNTRSAVEKRLSSLGKDISVFEPWRAPDCVCYGRDGSGETVRRYGSRTSPACVFVEAPSGSDEIELIQAIQDCRSAGISIFYRILNGS